MFKPVENTRVYQQITDQIQNMIMDGRLKSGDRLPAEREMAEIFGASRNSVREAVRVLDILGLVECRQGGGNYISGDFSTGFFEPLSIMFKLSGGSFLDILRTRKMLETEAGALAAKEMSDAERSELNRIMEKLCVAKSETRRIKLDADFHFKIIEGAGNYLIKSFYSAVSVLMKNFIVDARRLLTEGGKKEMLKEHHRQIALAIVDGDAQNAALRIREHFDFVIDNLKN
jgi:GntR family transcriptional repressor for pyruvate dehydrogenase complex